LEVPKSKKEVTLKGLSTKFGGTVRKRFSRVIFVKRMRRSCPSCGSRRLKREAVGIWTCRKCGFKVASEAYDVKT